MNVIVVVLTLKVLDQEVIDVVTRVGNLNGMAVAEGVVKQFDGIVLIDGYGKSDTQVVVHRLVRVADGLLGHEAEVLTAHAKAELEGLVGAAVHEIRDMELTNVVLLLIDVVILEADGVLVDPIGLAFQGRGELEGLGGDGLAKLHLHRLRTLEAHHDGLACGDHARGVAVEQRQQGLIEGLDALHESGILSAGPLLATGGQEAKQHHGRQQADAADFFHSITHIN